MAANTLNLFCLISGELVSNTFKVKLDINSDVSDLKKLIKTKSPNAFEHIDAKELVLWRATIPIDENAEEESIITLDGLDDKTKLGNPRICLSKLFPESPDDTTYIIVERPLAELGIIIKPEKKVAFTWLAIVETATLDDLKKNIFIEYPHYAHDKYLEIFVYNGQAKPARIGDDEDLREILKIAKTASKTKLTISLDTPTKAFSAWKFKDVCTEFNLSESAGVDINVIPPFTDIPAVSLDSDREKEVLAQLKIEIESRVEALKLFGANEATKSMVVGSFLVAATKLFKEDLYLVSQRDLRGRRGNGPLNFSVHSRSTHNYTLGVTEVKKEDFEQGVAQNIVQLESALTTTKKRKRETHAIDGEEEKIRSYGIVTDAEKWILIECTLQKDENVSCRITDSELQRRVAGGCEICFRKACMALVTDAG
ncbi:hypothetical protein BGZ51_009425 [Haplosporangium sp. Z 767]|nr:hypothetical protein BGZ51_009425 [Haplosporangium sp. Z 767]